MVDPPTLEPASALSPLSLASLFLGLPACNPTPEDQFKVHPETESLLSSANSTPQKAGKATETVVEERQGRGWVVSVESRVLGVWMLLRDLCLFYSLITTSFYLAFSHPGPELLVVDLIVWIIFLLDILRTFFSTYLDEDSQEVRDLGSIASHYLTSSFFLDLLAVIPLTFAGLPEVEYYFRMVRLLKAKETLDLLDGDGLGAVLPFFLRLYLGREFKLNLKDKHMAMIIHILLYLGFSTYTIACVWFWYTEKVKGADTNYYFPAHSFKERFPADSTSWQYLERSWYYILTTFATIGYGDLAATNFYETLMLIFVVALGVTSYSMIIGEFNLIVSELHNLKDERVGDFHLWLAEIESVQGPMDPSLKSRLAREYTLFDKQDRLRGLLVKWWQAETVDSLISPDDPYISDIPEATIRAIKDYLFDDLHSLYRKSFFRSADFMYDITFNLLPRSYLHGELILSEGEEATEVLLVTKGRVAVGPVIDGAFTTTLMLPQNCIVGLYSAFHASESYTNFKAVQSEGVKGWALPCKALMQVVKEKHCEHAKFLFVETNKEAKFIKSAISIHRRQLRKDSKEGIFADFARSVIRTRPDREEKMSYLDSFVGKEGEFVRNM